MLKILRHRYEWEGSSWRIKENIFVALGKIGDERALPDAAHYVESEADWYVKQGALNYLIHINGSEARAVLWKTYQRFQEPEVALCLVQVGETAVLPDLRNRLRIWLDDFGKGGWSKTDYWGVFYCVHALLIAQDADATPELRRALDMFKQRNAETERYIAEAASRYIPQLLLDEGRAQALVPDLERFLEKHPATDQQPPPANL